MRKFIATLLAAAIAIAAAAAPAAAHDRDHDDYVAGAIIGAFIAGAAIVAAVADDGYDYEYEPRRVSHRTPRPDRRWGAGPDRTCGGHRYRDFAKRQLCGNGEIMETGDYCGGHMIPRVFPDGRTQWKCWRH